jgi:molybdopterin-containing oxidoreductase family iron-sulfur binding subunit
MARQALEILPGEHHVGPRPGEELSGPSRRDFLKAAGFAMAGAGLAGCQRAPERHAVPYLVQPEGIVPGRAYYYASVCGGCSAGCGLLVKNRDGRPIKLEGNPEHPLSRGGLCAAGQASLLGLYDERRLRQPKREQQDVQWAAVDQDIRSQLQAVVRQGKAVRFLTSSQVGPSTRAQIHSFLAGFPGSRHVIHDARGGSAIADAHARTHGARVVPHYLLESAEVIVGFDADFLGTWLSPVEFTAAYQAGRRVDATPSRMSYHVQFESCMSLTGARADQRLCVSPGDLGLVMSHLATRLAPWAGIALPAAALDAAPVSPRFLDHLAEHLHLPQNRQRSLVLCGSQDVNLQILANFLNHVLGSYGTTVDVTRPSQQVQGSDEYLQTLLRELHQGTVGALFVYGCNPVHDLPATAALTEELRRVPLLVCCGERLDETARLARYVCPVPHPLETWSDAEPVAGLVSVSQPAITPLGNTRSLLENLAAWMGRSQSAREVVRNTWERDVFPRQGGGGSFQAFWEQTLQHGFARVAPRPVRIENFNVNAVRLVTRASRQTESDFSLVLYSKVGMPNARHAYNAWLHELPDPISKVTWDNYASLSPASAAQLGVADGDVVRLEVADAAGPHTVELPTFVQPGQHDQVVAVALGYGSVLSARFADIGPRWLEGGPTVGPNGLVGQNAAGFLTWDSSTLRFSRDGVRLTRTGARHPLACTQGYDRITVPAHLAPHGEERPPLVHVMTLAALRRQPAAPPADEARDPLWPDNHEPTGARWGMVIDLNACTGCSACVIACQVENNIPVVGKDEVRRHREMHWLRLDRYYADRDARVDVDVQPMLCHHCGNAPCEAVCPVLATVHSTEGLNQQVYNRCVGTRYCANNCPYKVRRFNWFDYAHDDTLQNLSLNPDVTVRSRGVMEKCTFCIQRIQEARIEASARGLPVADGAFQTACQQSCPAQAITFGNLNDRRSRVSRAGHNPRRYQVLEELNVRPAVCYLAVVRNRPVNTEGAANG